MVCDSTCICHALAFCLDASNKTNYFILFTRSLSNVTPNGNRKTKCSFRVCQGDFPTLFTFIGHDVFDFPHTGKFAENNSNFVLEQCIEHLKHEIVLWEAYPIHGVAIGGSFS